MALSDSGLKAKMAERIFQGLKREFASVDSVDNYAPIVEEQWRKLAAALSDIALDIVSSIQSDAEVQPGISVSDGSSTSSTGTIK